VGERALPIHDEKEIMTGVVGGRLAKAA
jgi:hypothetical protein